MASDAIPSFRDAASGATAFDTMEFFLRSRLAKLSTFKMVQVVAITNTGGVSPIGTVDVQPLVPQIDAEGNTVDYPVLYGLPYLRVMGGTNAVIMDPAVGDIGMAGFADRDTSAAIAAKGAAPPGSDRRHSIADGFFFGGIPLGVTPTQYVQYQSSGITINSPTAITAQIGTSSSAARLVMNSSGLVMSFGGHSITINSAGIAISGAVTGDNSATFTGEGTFNGGHTVSAHKHNVPGIQTGGSTVPSATPTG